ncbi:hypothetical protein PCANC_25926 [Puccinia coronata f. sp. avenae]|uniref:F-box domain-containing protein n=1 Tax=Puccinia coronata f. sp. avenae TaxID=200324 RepID=A0A2N5TJQ0_9BASI|nr:hypothetical protein PCANC_25926 [Puccinia coronata f. sp. avenae]
MSNILDLPREILELIFSHLVTTPTKWGHPLHRASFEAYTAAHLRLVCRAWADWLYEHHLYRTLTFDSASRSLAFIDYLGRRSRKLPRAHCQYLEVDFIWAYHHPPQSPQRDMINPDILETLLELFSDTIVTLDLKFVDFFTLPTQTIKAIGRLTNLYNLHLNLSRWPSGDLTFNEADPACFNSLILEAQALRSLRLALPVSLPCKSGLMAASAYPAITHLDVEVANLHPDVILGISIALKPSLKFLSVHDFGRKTDAQLLVPVYETLRETIEGLSVNSISSLTPILSFNFPKLRFFAVHEWLVSIVDLLHWEMFYKAPIEMIAINSASGKESADGFTVDTFSPLPQLSKLVFMNAPQNYSPAPMYLIACEARHIKCIYLDHDEMSLIMPS